MTLGGNAFHVRAPATGNARSPSEDRRVAGTARSVLEADTNAVSGENESRKRALSSPRGIQGRDHEDSDIPQDAEFEIHAFWHRHPVKLLQLWSHVVVSTDKLT